MHEKPLILTAAPQAPLEGLDPRVKLLCVAVWAVCVVTVPSGRFVLMGVYAAILAAVLATNPRLVGKFLRRFAPALPALALFCLLLPFFREGEVLWEWGVVGITREGLMIAARVGSVATLCVGAIALVWASTTQDMLLGALRGLGVPAVFVGILGFMLRYLEVLRPELHRLTDARAARTIGRGGPGRLRSGANVVGTLVLRAHDRAERVADAMAARGYTGRLRTFQHTHVGALDIAAGVAFAAAVILLRVALGS